MAKRPNILFILADDHASKAISCYGAGINHTPNIDRLAHEGMKFNHCYVTNSICTPSRAAILTGTHNHVNGVMTLDNKINKHLPSVAKTLRTGGYATAMIGKWHLGEGKEHEPSGFDEWSILPGQGEYWDPEFIDPSGTHVEKGYATDIITDKCLAWIDKVQAQEPNKPFFLMCHHKAPHRSWEFHPKHKHLYSDPIKVPESYDDNYKHRARAAKLAKMRVAEDLTYFDLGLVQPEGGDEVGGRVHQEGASVHRKIPMPQDVSGLRLIDKADGHVFTFQTGAELADFKFQRYMQRYLRTIQSIDDSVGRMLDHLDHKGLAKKTIVIYSSDQGFFLGEHGWFDKRFMYEESFQMPFLVRYPAEIAAGSETDAIVCNVDFAPTWLDFARLRPPTYMQGVSFRPVLQSPQGTAPPGWQQVAYHRYWMNNDVIHNALAHYGVRDQRYKLIYWYNEDFGVAGARPGTDYKEKEWELFDCDKDPLELFNVYNEKEYQAVVRDMTALLEAKMAEIGDEPVHPSEPVLLQAISALFSSLANTTCRGRGRPDGGLAAPAALVETKRSAVLDLSLAAPTASGGISVPQNSRDLNPTADGRNAENESIIGPPAPAGSSDLSCAASFSESTADHYASHPSLLSPDGACPGPQDTFPTTGPPEPNTQNTASDQSPADSTSSFPQLSPASPLHGAQLQQSTSVLLERINDFFLYLYPLPSYSFLHFATTKARCVAGTLDKALAFSICGISFLHSGARQRRSTASRCPCRGASWIRAAEIVILENLENPTLTRLQALLLIINYRMETGAFQRAFMLSALAARSAAVMRLNHERTDLNFVAREVRRRITWSLKLIDRYFSIGLPEFELCPYETIYLQLPCAEENFSAELMGDATNVHSTAVDMSRNDSGCYNICVGLESLRRDIMKMNRGIALYDEPFPQLSRLIADIERDLYIIGSRMSHGTEFGPSQITKILETPWLPRYVLMHLSWHQCHCDIYRLLLPGFSEAAPRPVLDACDPQLLADAELQCLHHASAIINILANLNQQSTVPHLLEFDTVICAYHAIRMVLFTSRFGKAADRPTAEFATSRANLCLTALRRFFPSSVLVKPVIDEIERTIAVFVSSSSTEQDVTTVPSRHSSPTAAAVTLNPENTTKSLSAMEKLRERLAIHSLLRRAEFSDGHDAHDTESPYQTGLSTLSSPPPTSTRAAEKMMQRTSRLSVDRVQILAPDVRSECLPRTSPSEQSESNLAGMLLGLRNGGHYSQVRSSESMQERTLGELDNWELDSMVQQHGWDGPPFPWFGLQEQDWLSGNYS
ncbi:hypothetical protein MHUMG1_03657 [Metarhizium humberi]|uniref:Sulfatase n=1 Tax=Metarhizium humberi TaxID=2596975 RepID=A0A9P8MFK1_9HYPO|nr:hypothetical protein MHUMG1_03657 [Metarhizium humberi]